MVARRSSIALRRLSHQTDAIHTRWVWSSSKAIFGTIPTSLCPIIEQASTGFWSLGMIIILMAIHPRGYPVVVKNRSVLRLLLGFLLFGICGQKTVADEKPAVR